MFKKLRNRFLLLNMLAVTLVTALAFAAVYRSTSGNIQFTNARTLADVLRGGAVSSLTLRNDLTGSVSAYVAPGGGYSFTLETDDGGRLTAVRSQCGLAGEEYQRAAAFALSGAAGTITLGGRAWAAARQRTDAGYLVACLDVTQSQAMLRSLTTTLLAVAAIMLLFLLLVCTFFANRAIAPLREAFNKQRRFVADASHELKTPLSIITANYDALLAHREETIDSQMRWLTHLRQGTDRMTRLTGDLLTLAKLEERTQARVKAPFDMSCEVRECAASFEGAMAGRAIRLMLDIAPDVRVTGERAGVRQVADILLDNALKYADEGGQVRVALRAGRREAALRVANTGPGIPRGDLPRVFERFYRADTARAWASAGHGLGLAIAKAAADGFGGRLTADSADGWTTFTLTVGL